MKNAFCTFIYGNYYRFIPYYLLGINKNYPQASILILYNNTLPEIYKKLIDTYSNAILFEKVGEDTDWLNNFNHRGAAKQTLRHVLRLDIFNDFDNIYFGDVDIILLKEEYSLFDFHIKQAKKSGLPFSNRVRPLPNNPETLSNRLTGLHFVEVKPYYEKMDSVINKFMNNENYRSDILDKSQRNENVLYYLCMDAFKFNPFQVSQNERPWHGFHLGMVRGKHNLDIKTIEENSSLGIENLKRQLSEFNQQGIIDQLLLKFECIEVFNTYKYLNLKLGNRVKLKYLILNQVKKFFGYSRMLKKRLINA